MENIEKFVLSLKEFEGGVLHKNAGETDITNGYGIYKGDNPKAEVFTYYADLAKELGIKTASSKWTKEEIKKVNDVIDPDRELQLSIEFYQEYFKPLSKFIDLFSLDPLISVPYGNIFLNSNTIGNKSLQQSVNLIIESNLRNTFPEIATMNKIAEDGIVGPGTRKVVYFLNELFGEKAIYERELFFNYWCNIFISLCKTNYVDLSTDNLKKTGTDKQLQYLRGWINRCDKLVYKGKKGL